MNERFIYDEKTSSLYSPEGIFLKKVFCPKAMNWNQLKIEDGEERWRGCSKCSEKVINLDVVEPQFVYKNLESDFSHVCVHASSKSKNVIFLKDPDEIPKASFKKNDEGLLPIYTARNFEDIERAVNIEYWPDVRMLNYDIENIRYKVAIGQHQETGRIKKSGDYRSFINSFSSLHSDVENIEKYDWKEVIPFKYYYPNYQKSPIAAYLIPKGTPDGTKVIVIDPIEDIVGGEWNQGNAWRADYVPGYVENKKIMLEPEKVEVKRFMG